MLFSFLIITIHHRDRRLQPLGELDRVSLLSLISSLSYDLISSLTSDPISLILSSLISLSHLISLIAEGGEFAFVLLGCFSSYSYTPFG